jgi:hypothetical protein
MAQINLVFNGVDNVSQIVSQINQQMQNAEKSAGNLTNKLLGVSSALQIFSFAKNKVDMLTNSVSGLVGEYQHQLEMETRLATVMQARFGANSSTISAMKDVLKQQELATGYSYEMLTNGAQELATYITDAKTLKGLMPVLANMAKQGGVNSEQGMMSYATMLGKVMGGDMGGMSKRGYVFSDAEKEAFKLMNEEQKLAFITKTVNESIGQQAQALNALNPQSVQSISVQLGNMRKELGKTLKPFQDMFQLVTMRWKLAFYEDILKALQFIQKHINGVVIALGALGVAILAVGVYFAILKREAIASAIATAVAWAIAHAPLIGIISLILLIISALALFLAFSEKTFKAVGIAIGVLVAGAINGFVDVRNFIAIIAEWIVNTFWKVVDKVSDFFLSMAQDIIKIITPLAGAIGKIFHQDWDEKLIEFQNKIEELKGDGPITVDYGRMDRVSYKDYIVKGGEIGSNLSEQFQGAIDKLTGGLKKAVGDGLSQQGNQFKFASDGSLLTSDTSSVDIAQDYKDLLSTKATERFFFKQSNIRPQINIEMNGTNVTAEDVRDEVASVLNKFTGTMTEALYSNGVA